MDKIFIFLRKKTEFHTVLRHGQRSVAEPGPTPSPWSIVSKDESGPQECNKALHNHSHIEIYFVKTQPNHSQVEFGLTRLWVL